MLINSHLDLKVLSLISDHIGRYIIMTDIQQGLEIMKHCKCIFSSKRKSGYKLD